MLREPSEVIIYRNPLEYAFWHSGGALFIVMIASVACIITALIVAKIWDKLFPRKWHSKMQGYASLSAGGFAFVAVLYYMV